MPLYKRAKKATTALREFLMRHMKSETVLIGKHLNEFVWAHGMRNPPHHVKVTCVKGDDGVVKAELFGVKLEQKVEKGKDKGAVAKVKEAITGKKDEKPAEKKEPAAKVAKEPKAEKPAKESKPEAKK